MGDGLRRCAERRAETSVAVGTIFAGTGTPLVSWFAAVWYVVNQKQGVSALGLQRGVGLAATRPPGRGCTSCAARWSFRAASRCPAPWRSMSATLARAPVPAVRLATRSW
jgi:hypothetical protein